MAADELADEAIASLRDALNAKKKYRVSCPKCKANFAAPFPDYMIRVKAAEFLRDTGKGKPAQAKAPVEKEVQTKNLEDLSIEELLALAGGEDGGEEADGLNQALEEG